MKAAQKKGGLLNKERLLKAVRKMNAKNEHERNQHAADVDAHIGELEQVVIACQETMKRLTAQKDSEEYIAARTQRDKLLAEITALREEVDYEAEKRRIDAELSAQKDLHERERQAAAIAFAETARKVHAATHTGPAHVKHPKPWDGTKDAGNVLLRHFAPLGESDPSLLRVEWTRFDYRPSIPWRPVRQHELTTWDSLLLYSNDKDDRVVRKDWRSAPNGLHDGRMETGAVPPAAHPTPVKKMTSPTRAPPVPGHVVPRRHYTSEVVPGDLLDTLTTKQKRLPLHPSYLLDTRARHDAQWKKPKGGEQKFTYIPSEKPMTHNEAQRAFLFTVPDRNFYDPKKDGKAPFLKPDPRPYPVFSRVPLEGEWLQKHDKEVEEQLLRNFYTQAAIQAGELDAEAVAAADEAAEEAQQGGRGATATGGFTSGGRRSGVLAGMGQSSLGGPSRSGKYLFGAAAMRVAEEKLRNELIERAAAEGRAVADLGFSASGFVAAQEDAAAIKTGAALLRGTVTRNSGTAHMHR